MDSKASFVEINVTAAGSEGQGIGALPSGKTCFVAGVFPGERCLCEVVSETSKYAVCDAVEGAESIHHLVVLGDDV